MYEDKERIHELAQGCSAGRLSPEELEEYDAYVRHGGMLAILHSKARKVLNRPMTFKSNQA